MSGSLSAGLVGEKVLAGMGTRQNNLVAHLRVWQRSAARQIASAYRSFTVSKYLSFLSSSSNFIGPWESGKAAGFALRDVQQFIESLAAGGQLMPGMSPPDEPVYVGNDCVLMPCRCVAEHAPEAAAGNATATGVAA